MLGLLSLGGIGLIVADVAKSFMPTEVAVIVTFVTTMISFVSIILPLMEKLILQFDYNAHREDMINFFRARGKEPYTTQSIQYDKISPVSAPHDLFYVVAKSIHKGPIRHVDGYQQLATCYYVFTMSASHVREKLEIMGEYLSAIISKIMTKILQDRPQKRQEFFLIVPYGRNVLLGEYISDKLNIPILVSEIGKPKNDRGGVVDIHMDIYESFYQTFVGVDALEERICELYQTSDRDIELNGILLDDNTSRGTQFINVASYFNEELGVEGRTQMGEAFKKHLGIQSEGVLSFRAIQYCATLFLAFNCNRNNCCESMRKANLILQYYFELGEDVKAKLYDMRDDLNVYKMQLLEKKESIETLADQCGFIGRESREIYDAVKTLE